MENSNTFIKDPHAVLDYAFDWSQWLEDEETIVSYTITAASGITSASSSFTTTGSVVTWITGGTVGVRYPVACLITTSASRVDERTIKIDVRNR